MAMTVRDAMTTAVITVTPETPLREVARLLVEHSISGLPVVDPDGAVVGVVSEADLLVKEEGPQHPPHRWIERLLGGSDDARHEQAKAAAETAGEAMTSPPVTIEAERPVSVAAETMVHRGINRLPVVDAGRLVGIVTRADLVRAYVRSDEELAETIRNEVLLKALWLDPDRFQVAVREGVARIGGAVERRSTAEAIERVASMVPGVVHVETDVRWEVDDRKLEAPGPDYVSPFEAPRTR